TSSIFKVIKCEASVNYCQNCTLLLLLIINEQLSKFENVSRETFLFFDNRRYSLLDVSGCSSV
ncbi:MAG: hypothetical protein LBM19_02920, partial [Holosporales bacterium]|nr:hypothetical protein [Holosporales bacterium]